jgi:hypothetical protein
MFRKDLKQKKNKETEIEDLILFSTYFFLINISEKLFKIETE